MKTFTETLKNGKAVLTGYVHDLSKEMPNADTRPAALVFPGGGYMICSDREAEPVALAYLAEGYNAFVLRYRVGTDEPAANSFSDAEEAIAYLHENAAELRIDKDRIAVIGFSAGGHLAAWLSTLGKLKPAAAILGYPCILPEIGKLLGKDLPDLCESVSSATPPTFIFTTRNDALVPAKHALRYADALDRGNIGFELHVFGDGAHGLSLAKPFTASGKATYVNTDVAQWFGLSVNWLRNVLGDFPVKEGEPQAQDATLGCRTPLHVLMDNEETRSVVLEVLPQITDIIRQAEETGQGDIIYNTSIKQIARVRPELIEEEKITILDERLRAVCGPQM